MTVHGQIRLREVHLHRRPAFQDIVVVQTVSRQPVRSGYKKGEGCEKLKKQGGKFSWLSKFPSAIQIEQKSLSVQVDEAFSHENRTSVQLSRIRYI